MAVVSALMLLDWANLVVSVNLAVLVKYLDKDLARAKFKLLVLMLPAADQPSIMPETPKLTVPALLATMLPLLLLIEPLLLPLLQEPQLLDNKVFASMAYKPVQSKPALTETTLPLPLPTKLLLPPLLLEALVDKLPLAIDSDVLIPSVLHKHAPLLTAETPPLPMLTLLDLKDPVLLSLFMAIEFSTALRSADHQPSNSAVATQSALTPTASTPITEMLLLLANIDSLKLPMTENVPLLASIEPLLYMLLLSINKLLTSVLLDSLVTATIISPEATVVFLRFVNPLSNKRPQLLLQLLAPVTYNTDMLLMLTLASTKEARQATATVEVVPMATVPDTVTADGECEGTGTSG